MGWIGLGALVVSVSFLLFKHPLGSWNFAHLHEWLRNRRGASPNTVTNIRSSPTALPPSPPESTSILDREGSKADEHRTDPISDDSTPKATPVQLPLIDVPTLNLESPAVVEERPNISLNSNNNTTLSQNCSPLLDSPIKPSSSPVAKNDSTRNTLMGPPPLPTLKGQRQTASSSIPNSGSMLPPPRPSLNVPLRPPPSAASSLRAPRPRGLTSSTLAPVHVQGKLQPSRQVVLEPGHSPLDWAALTSNPNHKLRGDNLPPTLIRVTPSMLKAHNGRKGRDAWTSYMGKVYNITPYLPFHPGGKGELLRGAGKNSEKLFAEIHPWVNWDGMLAECMVGILVSEDYNASGDGSLEEMD
ncbi:heme/steroid binding protein [Blastomyces dermatitidis ER-3]|uniref:Heme/steroid binding protein n=2 Tax=Ajellomyces dermatitidis TaxID=5039 RepID=F2TGZ4_AJEDA|nr:heme/steroid binding protein [Blastomyces dermatitidis ER-3]EGE82507.1 heme/steroid binding protein [Blastomyces dermatitidis ATCC 18188]EQL29246.1 hypothetical protein BDFG_08102 [Blastomyces dermatitidis ATCC 26199]EEQ92276.1 heme/steroid binding protein [Blastomyces dermatitidis ER-3]EQL29247.1 hypothetical protein, variant 1 [Blastomyces dermatitidis ATCC 26199]EQL29248.1 hypothetical protein, variant 2 [Blastomyces dermatitidis ATCC 26199]